MDNISLKTLIWVGGIVFILSLIPSGILFYQNYSLRKQNEVLANQTKISYKTVSDSIQRAESRLVSSQEELTKFAAKNNLDIEAIKRDVNSLGARLEAVAVTEAKTTTIIRNNYYSDETEPSQVQVPECPEDGRPIDIHGYTKNVETTNLTDSNGMRIADVSFTAAKNPPWSSKIYGIRYKILNTASRDRQGKLILYTELQASNEEAQPGRIFKVPGTSSELVEIPPSSPGWDWWNPYLYLTSNLSLGVWPNIEFSASFGIGFSIWSYRSMWRFLGITAGYDAYQNSFRASLIPVLVNIGDPLPFFSDLWIYLDVGIDTNSLLTVGLGISTAI